MNENFSHLLIGAPPWIVMTAIIFYAIAQVATLMLQVFQFVTSRFNAKEIVATRAKAKEINHTLNNVSEKVDAVATIVQNGHNGHT